MLTHVIVLVIALASSLADTKRGDFSYSSINVISAYTLKLIHFVDFPEGGSPERICVVGDELVGLALVQLQNKQTSPKVNIRGRDPTSNFDDCNVLFIGHEAAESIRSIAFTIKDRPVLTMSNVKGSLGMGIMIEFVEVDQSIKMDISLKNSYKSGVKISSKLLSIARYVETD